MSMVGGGKATFEPDMEETIQEEFPKMKGQIRPEGQKSLQKVIFRPEFN